MKLEDKVNNILNQLPQDYYNTLMSFEQNIIISYIKTKVDKRCKLSKEHKEYLSKLSKYDTNLMYLLLKIVKLTDYKQWTAIEFSEIRKEFSIREKDLDNILWEISHKFKDMHWECTKGLNQIRF